MNRTNCMQGQLMHDGTNGRGKRPPDAIAAGLQETFS